MSSVELRAIHKRFGKRDVLRDINLSIAPGEFVVVIGPSGCGKSSLMRLVAGLDDASAGDILIDGHAMNAVPPGERNVAMVFQNYALYPHMTVRENIVFGLKQKRLPPAEIDARLAQAARMLQLDSLLERKPRELSGGQRQRVAIGRAIVRQPKVFLFDEPLSNLDAALRVHTRVEIAALHRTLGNASVLYVTHDQVEAMTLADRIVLLRPLDEDGLPSVAQIGTPLALYHRPASRFVAGFIGSPSMNFLPARMTVVHGDGVAVLCGNLRFVVPVDPAGAAVDDAVTLGIRPEHVRLERAGTSRAVGALRARLYHIERLGEHAYAYVRLVDGGHALTVKTLDDALSPGTEVNLRFAQEAMHLFRADGSAFMRAPCPDPPMPQDGELPAQQRKDMASTNARVALLHACRAFERAAFPRAMTRPLVD